MIKMFHVYKSYQKETMALSDINLDIGKGEFMFITGPSGAGKTTLLKMIFCAEWPTSGQILVDGTLGGGGHTRLLAECVVPGGFVVALDRDPYAIAAAEVALKGLAVKLAQANYCELPEVLGQIGVGRVHGIVLDLGLSSDQLADERRGFSFDSRSRVWAISRS